jgi:hypothetical protein
LSIFQLVIGDWFSSGIYLCCTIFLFWTTFVLDQTESQRRRSNSLSH